MKIGFLFPGQGAQCVGMGKDLYDKYEEIKNVYEKASKKVNVNIADITFNSTEEELAQTKNSQIAIYTMSLGILEILSKNGIKAHGVAGLSLGEYSALTYAGAFDFETGVEIVTKRGEIMQNNIPAGNWKMAGVLGLADEIVEEACEKVTKGFVVPANYNCPGQVIVSGDEEGIEEFSAIAKEAGARKVTPLNTKGPFHTEKLEQAAIKLKEELDKIEIKTPNITVYKNIDSSKYSANDNFAEILGKHVQNPVRFTGIIQNMIDEGIDTFVEIGPGKVLTGLVKRVSKDVKLININSVESLEQAILELKEM